MTTEKEQAGDHLNDCDSVEEEETGQEIASRILGFPNVMAALKSQRIAEMLANLPPSVKRRVKALERFLFETTNIEAKFYKEVHELECKYHKFCIPLYDKRDKHLIDIKSTCEANPMVFTSDFHFSPNEHFTNTVLTKHPPTVPEDTKEGDINGDLHAILTSDFEIGHYIREIINPKAVLYSTGEGIEDEEENDVEVEIIKFT
ncbi:hypothetical protein HHI36_003223 [Cryptolaemus montrouzieri]|uniref:Uncharacterized protein n=1 Tax=Cryptolaemus montrouzieri TaxID=559131 RepID=A0ABD2PDC0_9CUCU